jgi:hypothetical protein
MDDNPTLTKQESVTVGSGGCGKSGQTVKVSTKGQQLEFTMKSPVPLAEKQYVFWQEVTAQAVTFKNAGASLPAGSVTCTCGSNTWNTVLTLAQDKSFLKLKLPDRATGATSAVVCAKGDLSCKVNEWSSGTTVTEMTATCFACDSSIGDNGACTKENSAKTVANSGIGVVRYAQAVTFKMKQDGTASTDVLKIKNVLYVPNSKTAIGRFYFQPSTTMKLYSGSTVDYTFGGQTWGTKGICSVMNANAAGTAPGATHSDTASSCVVADTKITVTMGKAASANFFVQVVGVNAWAASATKAITGNVINFAQTVQTQHTDATKNTMALAIVGTTTGASNEPTGTMTAVVARSLVNVMDCGMISFTITPKGADFGANSLAFISFPTYYNPSIGGMMRCSLYDTKAKADGERVYCKVAWDYTLQVFGPATAQKKDAAFELRVYGVAMNLHSAAGNFGVGLTNATYWGTDQKLVEFKTAADTTTGVWGGKAPIDVVSVALSSNNLRASTDITINFNLQATTDTVTNDADYVAVVLPYQWMGVASWMDGTAAPSASLKLVTTTGTGTAAKTTKSAVKGAVSQSAGCYVVFALVTTATKLAESKSYEFVLSGVPTAWNAALGAQMNLGSVVLSVGKSATGGFGYSSAQLFPALKSQAAATGLNLLEFASTNVAVSRGTYTRNAVCIQPGSGNFKADVAVKTTAANFKTNPATISAKMGSAKACADLGTASGTQMSTHNLYWTVVNGTKSYTNLPTLMATVNGNTATVNVPDKVTCSLGGSSVPIVVTSTAAPYSDIKVSITTSIATDEKKTDNSVGITPNAGEVATLSVSAASGVLGFKCAATVTGKELKYKLDGTDKAQFTLSATTIAVTAAKAGTKPTKPAMTLKMLADKSEASKTTVEGECPGMGNAWINLQPRSWGAKPMATVAEVRAAVTKAAGVTEGLHSKDQWCSSPVKAAAEKTTCAFQSGSKMEYSAVLYCETIEGWFFASTAAVNVTAADNGGKPVSLSLTYKKAIDVVKDNAVVLNICGKLAESMAVPYNRVTDNYGGYFGAPSPSLPAASATTTTATTTNTTANKTRMLNTTNATNATAKPKQTEWKLDLFIQPDPFAKKADNDATKKTATSADALKGVNAVTGTKYGTLTAANMAAATVT